MILPAKTDKKEENNGNPILFYSSDKNGDESKNAIFQGSSGKIFINIIFYSVYSLGKKAKKTMQEIGHELSWRMGRAIHFIKNGNLWKYIPAKVFALAVSCGAVAIFMIDTGIMSEVVYGSEAKYQAYSAVSENMESDVVIKKVGKNLEDARLAAITINQCKEDAAISQNSELCGADVKNKVLIDEEKREEQARLTAERAREAARKSAVAKSSARMPASFAVSGGRRVCEKKNDKPGKSKVNNKGKVHMDMECCLDPDEIPNPHCYYDPGKYGKYMK